MKKRKIIRIKYKREDGTLSRAHKIQIVHTKNGIKYQNMNQSKIISENNFLLEKDWPKKEPIIPKIIEKINPIIVAIKKRTLNIEKIKKPYAVMTKYIRENPLKVIVYALKSRIKKVLNILLDIEKLFKLAEYKLKEYKGKTIKFFVDQERERIISLTT
jgi:hypothetical protein